MNQSSNQLFCFMLGDQEIGIEMSSVLETNTLNSFTFLPNNPPYIIGVVNLRGEIVPIISLIKMFKVKVPDTLDKVVFITYEDFILGATVSKLQKPIVIKKEQIETYPHNIDSKTRNFYEGIVNINDRKIQVLSLPKLVEILLG